ncbi:hypothetical protein PEC18_20200 [Paucibacter sp. O1-1]|uniref:hypothetical protein n=1 Tax=Roseateles TaxID=93681 RepID=UPI0010F7BFDA|nr:hypothetical protein [Paucibacter sp. XJ19-41]MCU7373076.1 hypothetical protein [Paucibacter sp. O1-1]MDA3828075.1 hypothetical protein [Paucibacter sp. O1-1]MDC6166452.1 hypothetical protein [Paucibacter sp. XJ19-41]
MPTRQLMVTQIKCLDDTSEGGSDAPYLMVFMGHRNVPGGKLIRVRDPDWDGAFLAGKTMNMRQIVNEAEAGGAFVFAWLLEEDFDPDLGSGGVLQLMMQSVWNIYGGSAWANLNSDQLRSIVRPKLTDLLKSTLSNDEYLGSHSFVVPLVTTETSLSPLSYSGDGGSYKITFTVRIKGG